MQARIIARIFEKVVMSEIVFFFVLCVGQVSLCLTGATDRPDFYAVELSVRSSVFSLVVWEWKSAWVICCGTVRPLVSFSFGRVVRVSGIRMRLEVSPRRNFRGL